MTARLAISDDTATDERARVVTTAVLRAAESWQISKTTLGRVLGLSPASVTRLSAGGELRPGTKPYELGLLLLRLYRSLDAIMGGDRDLARQWLAAHNRALGGRPIDRITTIVGLTEAAAHVDAFRARV